VTEAELVTAEDKGTCKDLVKVDKTERWLAEKKVDFTTIREQSRKPVDQAPFFQDLLKPYDAALCCRLRQKIMIRQWVDG
jgi:hypothetical protein